MAIEEAKPVEAQDHGDLKSNVLHGEQHIHKGINMASVQPGCDLIYEKKIILLNTAMVDLGMGKYQWMIIACTGFGWFMDNFWMAAITIISPPIRQEFNVQRIAFLTVGKYAGLVAGSTLWPMTADFIGRRLAFNITLLISAVAGLVAAGSPNFVAITTFAAFIGVGTGGNQPVDSAIFLEFIPATHTYLLTMQSAFWSLGQAVAALIAWPLLAKYSCPSATTPGQCSYAENLGWRYTFWVYGGLTMLMFLARFAVQMYETPKYLLGRGKDAEAVAVIQEIARRNGKTTWLTLELLQAVDNELYSTTTPSADDVNRAIMQRMLQKFTPEKILALFSTKRMALSTSMMVFLWCAIGMGYPLYNSFLTIYLEDKGVSFGKPSHNVTFRNYALQAICGIPASILGGYTVDIKRIGRKGTGSLACFCTGLFLFLYTRASSPAGVLGFSCAVAFWQNIVYGLLYSYTPELFPAPIRGTGNGLVAMFNRLSGLMAPIIAVYVGVDTSMPIWISASLFVTAGIVFLFLPYEMRGRAAA